MLRWILLRQFLPEKAVGIVGALRKGKAWESTTIDVAVEHY